MITIRGQLTCDVCECGPVDCWLEQSGYGYSLADEVVHDAGWRYESRNSYDIRIEQEAYIDSMPVISRYQNDGNDFVTCSDDCRKAYEAQLRLTKGNSDRVQILKGIGQQAFPLPHQHPPIGGQTFTGDTADASHLTITRTTTGTGKE